MMDKHVLPPPSWPGLSRPSTYSLQPPGKTWMPGTSPGMTNEYPLHSMSAIIANRAVCP